MKAPETADEITLRNTLPDDKGSWFKYIGFTIAGRKKWHLGRSEVAAKIEAHRLMKLCDKYAGESWEYIDSQEMIAAGAEQGKAKAEQAKQETERQQIAAAERGTIAGAKGIYLAELGKRVGIVGGIETWTVKQATHKLERAIGLLPSGVTTLAHLDRQRLREWILVLASRPFKTPNPLATAKVKKAQAKERVSDRTCVGWIQEIKNLLNWLSEEGLYTLPKHAKEIWSIKPEPKEQTIRTLTQDEIKKLWNGAVNKFAPKDNNGEIRRLYLMLGLNAGFYGIDLATLTAEHVNGTHINKLRHKTRKTNNKLVKYRWWMFPETKALLAKFMPLKVSAGAIRQAWDRLTQTTGVKCSHSNCRDTGASWIQNHSGSRELADCYLAHSRKGVIDNYTLPMFERLDAELQAFYHEVIKPAIS